MLSKIDVKKFNTLIETNSLINSNYEDLNSVLIHILDSAARLCEGEASSLLITDKETEKLNYAISLGITGMETKNFSVKIGEGISGWSALHNRSVMVNDVKKDERHLTGFPSGFPGKLKSPLRAILAAPVRIREKCRGVIEIINKKGGKAFTKEDLIWLEIFATQAGIAVENARSTEKTQNQVQQLLNEQFKPEKLQKKLITKSPVMLEKLEIIERVAKTNTPVLLLGESGVGKKVYAEQIHQKSARNGKAFVKVNCSSIPENLFEISDGGTIFLDEVSELPLIVQSKLFRIFQDKTVDLRILAATNRDLEKQVEKGEFRSDLYYRLNVFPIVIPPLRQRPEDIPGLAEFFLQNCKNETASQAEAFSPEVMETMLSYSWPGNVRELKNCIKMACVTAKGKKIETVDLFPEKPSFVGLSADGNRKLKAAENIFRTQYIRQVLEENNWNQTETAKALDIQRTYLSRLIKELEINTKAFSQGRAAQGVIKNGRSTR